MILFDSPRPVNSQKLGDYLAQTHAVYTDLRTRKIYYIKL